MAAQEEHRMCLSSSQILEPIPRITVDGIEGSTIPGSVHLARYGGGSEYRAVDPLLSTRIVGANPELQPIWLEIVQVLETLSPQELVVKHGFHVEEMYPKGCIPKARELSWDCDCHLIVSRMPPSSQKGGNEQDKFASLMAHGFLFDQFHSSGRKAHQSFPLFSLMAPTNICSIGEAPQWLPIDGSFGWADQHVHKDEPIDLGDGFVYSEVFFGSDMARFSVEDPGEPAAMWVAVVDAERSKAFLACLVVLPNVDVEVSGASVREKSVFDDSIKSAKSVEDVTRALLDHYGARATRVTATILPANTSPKPGSSAQPAGSETTCSPELGNPGSRHE